MDISNKRWTLLVIDNNHEAVHYVQTILDNSPYTIVATNDGTEAFDLLLSEPDKFAAIILGQDILNINAVHLLHKINSCSAMKTIPVIMEASTGTIEEMEICMRAGARYYLPKPIDKSLMPNIIATAIRDKQRYHAAETSIWSAKPLNTLTSATFKIQTLDEAQAVAALLANECPNPRLAAVGISEILINAIEHGNLNISYEEKTILHEQSSWLSEIQSRLAQPQFKNKYVNVVYSKTNGHINIRVTDEGQGFDWRQYQTLDATRVFDNHGRGIIMARNLAFENMIYHGLGNDVECIIPLAL